MFSHYTFHDEIKKQDLPSGTKIEGKCIHCGKKRTTQKGITSNLVKHLKVNFYLIMITSYNHDHVQVETFSNPKIIVGSPFSYTPLFQTKNEGRELQ